MNPTTLVHFDEGHVMIISLEGTQQLFWMDKRTQLRCGPFEYLTTALMHWTHYEKNRIKLAQPEARDNIVHVDFVTKHRISREGL